MDAVRFSLVLDKMNGGVVAPDNRVSVVSEIPCESQGISIERCCRLHIRHMQYRRTLKELCGVGRRQCGHRHPPYGDTDCTCFIVLSSESVRLTSGISRGAQVSIAPSAACRVWP